MDKAPNPKDTHAAQPTAAPPNDPPWMLQHMYSYPKDSHAPEPTAGFPSGLLQLLQHTSVDPRDTRAPVPIAAPLACPFLLLLGRQWHPMHSHCLGPIAAHPSALPGLQ